MSTPITIRKNDFRRKAKGSGREEEADLHMKRRSLVYQASSHLCRFINALRAHSGQTRMSLLRRPQPPSHFHVPNKGLQWTSCERHSESHTEKSSAGTPPSQPRGVNSGWVATKEVPQTLPLPPDLTSGGTPGSDCRADRELRTSVPCTWGVTTLSFLFPMELVPGQSFLRTGQERGLGANDRSPLAAWGGHANLGSYCFVYRISQEVLSTEGRQRGCQVAGK